MTGFGTSEYCDSVYKINIEIKSVNHRYHDLSIHMPRTLNPLEDKVRKFVAQYLIRGKIDVFISFTVCQQRSSKIKVDKDLAIAYHESLRDLSSLLQMSPPDDVYAIANYQGVLSFDEDLADFTQFSAKLMKVLEAAVLHLLRMRVVEGENIFNDLIKRINNLENYVDAIEQRAPEIISDYQERLLAKVRTLLKSTEIDDVRITQDTLLFAEKINFTEEVVRLKSHFAQFKMVIASSDEVIGRKMDFMLQEMNRETNTIASKANDFFVAKIVVDLKSELEKIREQIQNIE